MVRYSGSTQIHDACAFLDKVWSGSSNEDKLLILNAPIPWRDMSTFDAIKKLLVMQRRSSSVELVPAIRDTGFLETMESLEKNMLLDSRADSNGTTRPKTTSMSLLRLEGFHKVVVFYVWMRFRNPVVYADPCVDDLKQRLEKVLNWGLESMSQELATTRGVQTPDIALAPLEDSTIAQPDHPIDRTPDILASPNHHSNPLD